MTVFVLPGPVCSERYRELFEKNFDELSLVGIHNLLHGVPSLLDRGLGFSPSSPWSSHISTAQANRTENASTHTLELSGVAWVSRFPTSTSVEDLTADFKSSVNSFIGAIQNAGGSVTITATYRPPERAYLMHYAWSVAHGKVKPNAVPAMTGVDIQWDHGNEKASKQAATDMVSGYGIVYAPSLTTNHANRTAIDMTISRVVGKKVKNKDGKEIEIKKLSDLNAVGATYGVHKLITDPPHWSSDGH